MLDPFSIKQPGREHMKQTRANKANKAKTVAHFLHYHVSRGTCQIECFFCNALFAATDACGSFKISAYF